MAKDIEIDIVLNKDQARAGAAAFHADQQKLARDLQATEQAAANRTADVQVGAARRARDARGRLIKQDVAETDAGAKQKAAAESAATDSIVGGFRRSKASGTEMVISISTGFTAAMGIIQKAADFVGGFGKAIDAAAEKSAALGKGFNVQRENLGQLAALKGVPADTAFVLKQAEFNVKAGLRPEEGIALQTSFLNAAAQHIAAGKISGPEADELQVKLGLLASAKQIDPKVVADLAGRQLGFKDYSKFGGKAAENVLADLNQAISLISSGGGAEGQVATEAVKLAAYTVDEDELKGLFPNIKEAAKFASIATEAVPEGQAEFAGSALRQLRKFGDKKAGPFLKAAGVTPEDDAITSLRKVGEHAEKMAAAGPAGTRPADVLGRAFTDQLGARALGSLYNLGVGGGLFEAREQVAQQNATPEQAQQFLDTYRGTDRGVLRTRQAQIELVKAQKGAKTASIDIIRQEAIAQLIKGGQLDSTKAEIEKFAIGAATFGALGDIDRYKIDVQVENILRQRGGTAATKGGFLGARLPSTTEEREAYFNEHIASIEAQGVSPLTGRPLPPADQAGGGAAMVPVLKSIDAKLTPKPVAPDPKPLVGRAKQLMRN